MGVRELIIGVVVLLVLYLLVALFRLIRLPAKRSAAPQPEYQTVLAPDPPLTEPNLTFTERREPAAGLPKPDREAFDALVELARLRFQIEALETSQSVLREEFDALRAEMDALRNARNVAPQYGEAVSLAQRGLDSAAIAERCDISVSEAELVAALARGTRSQE